MIDKFLESEGLAIKRNSLQLVGVAAMFTASKVRPCWVNLTKDNIKGTVVPIVDRIHIRYYLRVISGALIGSAFEVDELILN